jgi:uncharacterized protein (UPF0264 family)
MPEIAPQLLVSVRSAREALVALSGGADWIDLKEPSRGALAAVDTSVAREVVEAIAGRCPVSAALGELRDWETSLAQQLLAVPGVGVVKLGLAGCGPDWQQRWLDVAAEAGDQRLAAVVYADWQCASAPVPGAILEAAQAARCQYLLIDTYNKSAGSVFRCWSGPPLTSFLQQAREAAMTIVLAGSLTKADLEQIPRALVQIVAVRGAVCGGDRTASIDAALVADWKQAVAGNSLLAG